MSSYFGGGAIAIFGWCGWYVVARWWLAIEGGMDASDAEGGGATGMPTDTLSSIS